MAYSFAQSRQVELDSTSVKIRAVLLLPGTFMLCKHLPSPYPSHLGDSPSFENASCLFCVSPRCYVPCDFRFRTNRPWPLATSRRHFCLVVFPFRSACVVLSSPFLFALVCSHLLPPPPRIARSLGIITLQNLAFSRFRPSLGYKTNTWSLISSKVGSLEQDALIRGVRAVLHAGDLVNACQLCFVVRLTEYKYVDLQTAFRRLSVVFNDV